MEVDRMFYIKPNLKNMSQGARLEYIREVRHMTKEDVAAYFGFGGKEPNKTIREYENNTASPSPSRLEELAELFEVSVDAIRKYDFTNPIDEIYYQMWLEEQYPYYEFKLPDRFGDSSYNINVQKGINEWLKMREKRENYEITDQAYIEWKLNFQLEKELY